MTITHRHEVKEYVPKPGLPATYPRYLKPIPITEGRNAKVLLERLLARMARWGGGDPMTAPGLIRFLYSSWTAAADPLKYQEIRNSLIRGEIDPGFEAAFRQAYSQYVATTLAPAWRQVIAAGGQYIADGLAASQVAPSFRFSASGTAISEWIQTRGAQWVVDVTEGQREALAAVIDYYTVDRPVSAGEMARFLRPIIGLTPAQAQAVTDYREELLALVKKGELDTLKAEWMVENYSGYLHRLRAERIAVTEVSFAYNRGQHMALEQAKAEGFFDGYQRVEKIWFTGEDERVCFAASTPISTSAGVVPIADVPVGATVITSGGTQRVLDAMERQYAGAMVLLIADGHSLFCTVEHLIFTVEGWKEAGELNTKDLLKDIDQQVVRILAVIHFRLGDMHHTPTVTFEVMVSSELLRQIAVPIVPVEFNSNLQIGDCEIDAVPANLQFLLEWDAKLFEHFTEALLQSSFAGEMSVAAEGTESFFLLAARSHPHWFTALQAFFHNGRATALFGAVMPWTHLLTSEGLPAAAADAVDRRCETTGFGADGIAVRDGGTDLEGLPTGGTELLHHRLAHADFVTVPGAEASSVAAFSSTRREGDPADLALCGANLRRGRVVTGGRTVRMTPDDALWARELFTAVLTSISKRHVVHLLTELYSFTHSQSITVYNLAVEETHTYYADGLLVHNCDRCAPLHEKVVGFEETYPGGTKKEPNVIAPPLHPRCRCTLGYRVLEDTRQSGAEGG